MCCLNGPCRRTHSKAVAPPLKKGISMPPLCPIHFASDWLTFGLDSFTQVLWNTILSTSRVSEECSTNKSRGGGNVTAFIACDERYHVHIWGDTITFPALSDRNFTREGAMKSVIARRHVEVHNRANCQDSVQWLSTLAILGCLKLMFIQITNVKYGNCDRILISFNTKIILLSSPNTKLNRYHFKTNPISVCFNKTTSRTHSITTHLVFVHI